MFSSANLKVVYVREDLGKLKSIVIVVRLQSLREGTLGGDV
jgi:hypothetical protein